MKEQKHTCKYCKDCIFYYEYNHYSTTDYYCNYYEEEMRQYASKDYSSKELKKNKEYNYNCPYYINIEDVRDLAKLKVDRGFNSIAFAESQFEILDRIFEEKK